MILLVFLFPFYGSISFFVFLGGLFIDVDHYFYYLFEKKKFSLIGCYRDLIQENMRNRERFQKVTTRPIHLGWDRLHIFHVFEFWILMGILSFVHPLFFIISIGIVLHVSLDLFDLVKGRIYGCRAFSFIMWLYRRRFKRRVV